MFIEEKNYVNINVVPNSKLWSMYYLCSSKFILVLFPLLLDFPFKYVHDWYKCYNPTALLACFLYSLKSGSTVAWVSGFRSEKWVLRLTQPCHCTISLLFMSPLSSLSCQWQSVEGKLFDGPASHWGASLNTLNCFMLQKQG